jgi:hypothetical protein
MSSLSASWPGKPTSKSKLVRSALAVRAVEVPCSIDAIVIPDNTPGMASNPGSYLITDADVLPRIASDEGVPPAALWIEGGHVWKRTDDDGLRCVCSIGTPYWDEQAAATLAVRVIGRARTAP